MERVHNPLRPRASQRSSGLIRGVACGLLALSCSASIPARGDAGSARLPPSSARYSLICIIHGDGDYAWHDSTGREHTADADALAMVRRVAENNPQAEAFIYHEMPREHFLLFFPLHDGDLYYYRGGNLQAREAYWRDQGISRFDRELELYTRFHVNDAAPVARIFLYFGHEIPHGSGLPYDESYPGWVFGADNLADALRSFLHGAPPFDLVVLSSCFSGTPSTIAALAPYAQYIIASPDNLHLSYFDLLPLEHLETSRLGNDVPAFTKEFAHHAFDQLSQSVQTAVTVAAYNVAQVQPFLRYTGRQYARAEAIPAPSAGALRGDAEHCDCGTLAECALKDIDEGVLIYYRPAHFGRAKNRQRQSGWECWKDLMWRTESRLLPTHPPE